MDGEDYTRERLVASFMEVTGVGNTVDACDHLACCGWNLDEAVDLFLSVGAGPSGSRSPPPPSSSYSVPDEEEEDAPFVPARSRTPRGGRANGGEERRRSSASGSSSRPGSRWDRNEEEEENAARAPVPAARSGGRANDGDDRRRSGSGSARSGSRWDSETRVSSSSSSRRRRRRQRFRERDDGDEEEDGGRRRRVRARGNRVDDDAARIEVDRDLTSRLQLYDEALNSGSEDKKPSSAPAKEEEEKSLEDLFRPPRELTFAGGFHDAKLEAARRGRWLLVNVQDTGDDAALASFAQNRDVWASALVARFVRDHFVLWQADAAEAHHGAGQDEAAEEEARKVCAHYGVPLDKLPAVLVVDPVTGQAVARLHGASTDPNDLLVAVKSYIATKPVVPVIGANKPPVASANEPVNQEPPATTAAPATSSQRTSSRKVAPKVEKQDKAVPAVATVAPTVEKQGNAVAAVATVAPTVGKQSKAVQAVAAAAAAPTVEPAPAPVPKVCKLRIRMPDGRTVAKEFASGCPVAALFAYCRSELGEGGEAGRNKPFRLLRLVGCTREEIGDHRDASFQSLGLHMSTVSVLLG